MKALWRSSYRASLVVSIFLRIRFGKLPLKVRRTIQSKKVSYPALSHKFRAPVCRKPAKHSSCACRSGEAHLPTRMSFRSAPHQSLGTCFQNRHALQLPTLPLLATAPRARHKKLSHHSRKHGQQGDLLWGLLTWQVEIRTHTWCRCSWRGLLDDSRMTRSRATTTAQHQPKNHYRTKNASNLHGNLFIELFGEIKLQNEGKSKHLSL